MKNNSTLNFIFGFLSFVVFFDSQVLWAQPCDPIFEVTSGNVIKVNFGSKGSGIPVTTKKPNAPSESVAVFKASRSKVELPKIKVEVGLKEQVVDFINSTRDFMLSENINNLNQNDVWLLHASYIEVGSLVENAGNPHYGYTSEEIQSFKSAFARLKNIEAKKLYFNSLERMGFTLVPKTGVKILEPLSAKNYERLVVLNIGYDFVLWSIKGLAQINRIAGPEFVQRISNGSYRKSSIRNLKSHLEHLNLFLRELRDDPDFQLADLTEVKNLISKTKNLLESSTVVAARRLSRFSPFFETQELSRELNQQVQYFETLSFAMASSSPRFRLIAEKESDIIIDDKVVDVFERKILAALSQNTTLIQWQPIVMGFTLRLKMSEGVDLSDSKIKMLISLFEGVLKVAEARPDRYSLFGEFSRAEIKAANQLKIEVRKGLNLLLSQTL